MRETITVSLPRKVRQELDRVARREGVSRSDVLRVALEEHLFVRRFRALRRKIMAAAQGRGIFTDEDVFDRVS
jgi:metal-responsive CopG/Arc/MetJ family transcriptional regulator